MTQTMTSLIPDSGALRRYAKFYGDKTESLIVAASEALVSIV